MSNDPILPPQRRSDVARGLEVPAAAGDFALQRCRDCGMVQYPPQEFCMNCLSLRLDWKSHSRRGKVLATAVIYHSLEPAFQTGAPPNTGLVRHISGAILVAFMEADCAPEQEVNLALCLDSGGRVVVTAERIPE